MSVLTLCIKYALGRVTVEDVTWVFSELFGEGCVVKVTELVKQDRNSGKDFKIFFIECDQKKQVNSKLDKLAMFITQNQRSGDKKGARVKIDEAGHYWQVVFAKEQPGLQETKAAFKPSIVEEPEPTVQELEKAMEALQTKDELEFLHGKRAAEEGEIQEPVKKPLYCAALEQDAAETLRGKVFEVKIAHDDPIVLEAIRDTTRHFLTRQTTGL